MAGMIITALALAAALQAPPQPLGPLRPEMTLEQARKIPGSTALPAAGGAGLGVKVKADVAGKPFDITLKTTGRGTRTLELAWTGAASVVDCNKAYASLVLLLEQAYGPLHAGETTAPSQPGWRTAVANAADIWPIRPGMSVLGQGVARPGTAVQIIGQSQTTNYTSNWLALRRADFGKGRRHDVLVSGEAFGYGASETCRLQSYIRFVPKALPPSETFKAQTRWTAGTLNQPLRHAFAATLKPGEKIHAVLDCLVFRGGGHTYSCVARDPGDPTRLGIARRIAEDMVFRHDDLDPLDPVPLLTEVTIDLAYEDSLKPAPPAPVRPTVVWARPLTSAEFARYYPERALRMEKQGSARLECQIQPDGSLNCSVADETPAGYGFGDAGLKMLPHLRVKDRLADGKPSAGVWVSIPLKFEAH